MNGRALMDPKTLRDHPANSGLYGPITLEPGFVDSIRKDGIRQSIIVTRIDDDFYVVSGHRRRDAAILAELSEVPVEIHEYADLKAAEYDVIALNMTRHKSEAVVAREIEKLMEIHGEEAEARMKAGVPSSGTGRGGRTDDLVAEMLQISRSRLRNLLTVFGDQYREERVAETGLSKAKAKAIVRAWNVVRQERLADEYPLTAAVSRIRNLLTAAGKAAPSKPKVRTVSWSTRWTELPGDAKPTVHGRFGLENGRTLDLVDIHGTPSLIVGDRIATLDSDFLNSLSTEAE